MRVVSSSLPHPPQQKTWLKHNAECRLSAASYDIWYSKDVPQAQPFCAVAAQALRVTVRVQDLPSRLAGVQQHEPLFPALPLLCLHSTTNFIGSDCLSRSNTHTLNAAADFASTIQFRGLPRKSGAVLTETHTLNAAAGPTLSAVHKQVQGLDLLCAGPPQPQHTP